MQGVEISNEIPPVKTIILNSREIPPVKLLIIREFKIIVPEDEDLKRSNVGLLIAGDKKRHLT